jgi:hypothetical protein
MSVENAAPFLGFIGRNRKALAVLFGHDRMRNLEAIEADLRRTSQANAVEVPVPAKRPWWKFFAV